MQEHPLCPSCMGPLSSYYDIFSLLRADRIDKLIKEKNTNIDEADVLENFDENLQDIFEMLGIDLFCCRGRMNAGKDFYDFYRAN